MMPRRIIRDNINSLEKPALSIVMQTREQHVRRDKATNNICTAQGSRSEDVNSKYPDGVSSEVSEIKKRCADCHTTKTPLWRGGPAGPKSLCNACGIRNRKRRRALLGLNRGGAVKNKKYRSSNSDNKHGVSLKLRLVDLGREALLQRSAVEKQRRKLREEERAAVLLMALSCGSVYA
ncbi:hypothetical protein HHK36_022974 [Tetracentron sinense]|uniref:GATA-type domain-containing protein n=1 Tax=Tetracentron sinense TaxID=13715 RepID=A0A835D7A5_TETSI|nr:hypothetical protein HHK36_022974 [Tetracentron sinense]